MRKIIIILSVIFWVSAIYAQRYVGGDISLLPEYEAAGAKYKTHSGQPIADLVPWLEKEGMNAMRVRLFVNPHKYKDLHQNDANADNRYDPNACQDLDYILPLCKRISDAGIALMLDFHYSDTWADPANQWTPADWEGLGDEELYQKIYDYTKQTLETLKTNGITPAFIQPGNEISYGMLWGPLGTTSPKKVIMGNGTNWTRFGRLLSRAVEACRKVCPNAKIVLHTERVAQVDVTKNFYDKMQTLGVDYDIIGLSYYPYFHGDMSVLDKALSSLSTNCPDKEIMIVETGYTYKWEVPGTSVDCSNVWPYTDAGQNKFAADLVATLEKYGNVTGLFWWWMEYNAYGTKLSGWYNAPLFDSSTGCATSALETICSFAKSNNLEGIGKEYAADRNWYNLQGLPVSKPEKPGLYIHNHKKIILK